MSLEFLRIPKVFAQVASEAPHIRPDVLHDFMSGNFEPFNALVGEINAQAMRLGFIDGRKATVHRMLRPNYSAPVEIVINTWRLHFPGGVAVSFSPQTETSEQLSSVSLNSVTHPEHNPDYFAGFVFVRGQTAHIGLAQGSRGLPDKEFGKPLDFSELGENQAKFAVSLVSIAHEATSTQEPLDPTSFRPTFNPR